MSDDDKKVVNLQEKKAELRKLVDQEITDLENAAFGDDNAKLDEMNAKHAFINSVGGKPMVLCNIYSVVAGRDIVEFRSPDAIMTQYSNQSIQVGRNHIELGKWWVKNTYRREYDTVIFDPTKPKEFNKCINLWEGFAVKSYPGKWKLTLKHIYKVLANKDRTKFLYIIRWFAWMIQNPGEPAEVAIVFKGKQGAGKGFIFNQFIRIFGQHGLAISNRKHLTGQYNGHLKLISFLFADEAYYPGDKEIEGTLKQLITEPNIPIEDKFMKVGPSKNCLHIAMSSNNDWIVPAGDDTRRYFINEVTNDYAFNQTMSATREVYFERLWQEMDNGGREAMLFDLENMKLKGWHPRKSIPKTEEMQKQVLMSLPREFKVLLSWLDDGSFPGTFTIDREYMIASEELWAYLDKIEPRGKNLSIIQKAKAIKMLGFQKVKRTDRNYWKVPELQAIRDAWDAIHGKYPWDTEDNTWALIKNSF